MNARPEMNQELVRSLLDYDPETGIFLWKHRTPKMFSGKGRLSAEGECARWNGQFAGKRAGTTNTNGYRRIKIFDSFYLSEHVAAWLYVHGEYLPGQIDHRYGIKDDNRISELRRATKSQNGVNRPKPPSKSGELGIYWEPKRGTWKVTVRHQNQLLWGGRFRDKAGAIAKRDELLAQAHPEFRDRQSHP